MDAEGRIETTVAIMAVSEAEAMEQVHGLALTYTVELWEGGHMAGLVAREREMPKRVQPSKRYRLGPLELARINPSMA